MILKSVFIFCCLFAALKAQSTKILNYADEDIECNRKLSFNSKEIPFNPDANLSIVSMIF